MWFDCKRQQDCDPTLRAELGGASGGGGGRIHFRGLCDKDQQLLPCVRAPKPTTPRTPQHSPFPLAQTHHHATHLPCHAVATSYAPLLPPNAIPLMGARGNCRLGDHYKWITGQTPKVDALGNPFQEESSERIRKCAPPEPVMPSWEQGGLRSAECSSTAPPQGETHPAADSGIQGEVEKRSKRFYTEPFSQ